MNNSRDKALNTFIGSYGFALNDQEYSLVIESWQAATEQSQKEIADKDARIAELEACLHEIVNKSFTTYKAKNGKEVGIEDDAGEMCYIVPHEPIISAEHLVKSKTSELMVKVLHLAKDEMSKYKKG